MSGKHFLAALSVAALAGFCVVPFPAYAEIRLVHDAPDATNLSVRSAMDADIPRRTATARMKDKDILFITNRKIDYAADRIAQQRNEVLRSEDVFLKEPAVALTYGVATVSYPVNRRRGDQTYKSESDKQNPLFHFSLKSWEFAQSPLEFENLISGLQPESTSKAALLYVHGFENSFNNAAERLTQIAIDTNYAGRALLFSWPANNWLLDLPGAITCERLK